MKPTFYAVCMFLFATFVLTLSALSVFQPLAVSGKPAQVIIIRHGEKPEAGPGLTTKGKLRASALAPYFLFEEAVTRYKHPIAVYAPHEKGGKFEVRADLTVQPLVESLQQPLQNGYRKDEVDPLAQEILTEPRYQGRMVLICWEHTQIPNIAKALGAKDVPDHWPGKAYDRLWILTYHDDGQVTFQDLPQRLLFGDSKE